MIPTFWRESNCRWSTILRGLQNEGLHFLNGWERIRRPRGPQKKVGPLGRCSHFFPSKWGETPRRLAQRWFLRQEENTALSQNSTGVDAWVIVLTGRVFML
ncbi:hypothetical protein CYLTODRAFT_23334 [Cylindrobasidium torrendii FP15055 ss-10]|uniref:Uncharacterized protein n=1 Tax=Cylindrobasidium torrendii FP15055 ss-10 TaxID=1314674 RepID=A0A0D7B8C7_9AGAR|nr:hypothetical protein CYLTODRAFT_23334 [Cylindrobasidium torrendii FP15055 ss-10]